MKVKLKFFSTLRHHFQTSESEISVSSPKTAEEIFLQLFTDQKLAKKFLISTRFAVNWEYASADTLIHGGDELAFIPPVSGG